MSQVLELESPSSTLKHHREMILIVEDDVPLLRLLQIFLVDAGYSVLSARTGDEAVSAYTEHSGTISLVVTDLGLPGLSGKDEILALKRISPCIRIICTTGYLDPVVESELAKIGVTEYISKPYNPEEMLKKVRSVLDA